jgi:hypothetical protein
VQDIRVARPGLPGKPDLAVQVEPVAAGEHDALLQLAVAEQQPGDGFGAVEGGSDLLRFTGPLVGTAFAVDAARRLAGGTATLGLSSPLRLERARATVQAPVAYDLLSGALTTRTTGIDLTPTARELDVELGWSAAFGPGRSLRLGIAHAVNAGHVAGVHDTAGFATLVLR